MAVLRIDDRNGNPLAAPTNYACHPVVFGSYIFRHKYSADYPGVANSVVEKASWWKCPELFGTRCGWRHQSVLRGHANERERDPVVDIGPVNRSTIRWNRIVNVTLTGELPFG